MMMVEEAGRRVFVMKIAFRCCCLKYIGVSIAEASSFILINTWHRYEVALLKTIACHANLYIILSMLLSPSLSHHYH